MKLGKFKEFSNVQAELSALAAQLKAVRKAEERAAETRERQRQYEQAEANRQSILDKAVSYVRDIAVSFPDFMEEFELTADLPILERIAAELLDNVRLMKAHSVPSRVGKKFDGMGRADGGSWRNRSGETKPRILEAYTRPNGVSLDDLGEILGWKRNADGKIDGVGLYAAKTIKNEELYLLKIRVMSEGKIRTNRKAVTKDEIEHYGWRVDWKKQEVIDAVDENYFNEFRRLPLNDNLERERSRLPLHSRKERFDTHARHLLSYHAGLCFAN